MQSGVDGGEGGAGGGVRRKTWDRGAAPVVFKETEGKNAALSAAGVDPSYREYLTALQERNRTLRTMRKKEEARRAMIQERERGFELNFAGANEDRLKMKERERGSSKGQPLRGVVRGGIGGGGKWGRTRARSQWMQGSVHIQTERGSVVILRPPGRDQLRESIQWLQSDEGQGWLESDDGMNWLETQPEDEEAPSTVAKADPSSSLVIEKCLRLVAATLQFNGMSPAEGFIEFDSDGDGMMSLYDLCSTSSDLNLELADSELALMHAALLPDALGLVNLEAWTRGLMGIDASSELRERGLDPGTLVVPVPTNLEAPERGSAGEGRGIPSRGGAGTSHDGKAIVSPVGQYIKTGQMPEARVRKSGGGAGGIGSSVSSLKGGDGGMRTIRESRERGLSAGDGLNAGGIQGLNRGDDPGATAAEDEVDEDDALYDEDDALYEEDFEMHDDDDNNKIDDGRLERARESRKGASVGAAKRPGSAGTKTILDEIDWQRAAEGRDGSDISEEDDVLDASFSSAGGHVCEMVEDTEESGEVVDEVSEIEGGIEEEEEEEEEIYGSMRAGGSPDRWATQRQNSLEGVSQHIITSGGGKQQRAAAIRGSAPASTSVSVAASSTVNFPPKLSVGRNVQGEVQALLEALERENTEALTARQTPRVDDAQGRKVKKPGLRAFPKLPGGGSGGPGFMEVKHPAVVKTQVAASHRDATALENSEEETSSASISFFAALPVSFPSPSAATGAKGALEQSDILVEEMDSPLGADRVEMNRPGTSDLISRMRGLDAQKQQMLLKVMDRLEMGTGDDLGATALLSQIVGGLGGIAAKQQHPSTRVEGKDSAKLSSEMQIDEVVFEVLSNWGHASMVGLTELELFDAAGQRLRVGRAGVFQSGFGGMGGGGGGISKVVSCKAVSSDAGDMWKAGMCEGGRVTMLVPTGGREPCWLRIWNYNAGSLEVDKGVKRARVWVCGAVVWEGEVKRGCGDISSDWSTTVSLSATGGGLPPPTHPDLEIHKALQSKGAIDLVSSKEKRMILASLSGREVVGGGARSPTCGRGNEEFAESSGPIWLIGAAKKKKEFELGGDLVHPRLIGDGGRRRGISERANVLLGMEDGQEQGKAIMSRSSETVPVIKSSQSPSSSLGDMNDALMDSGTLRVARQGRRAMRNADLEASLDSLSLFRTSHAGRVGVPIFEPTPPSAASMDVSSQEITQYSDQYLSGPRAESSSSLQDKALCTDNLFVREVLKKSCEDNPSDQVSSARVKAPEAVLMNTPKQGEIRRMGLFEQVSRFVSSALLSVEEGDLLYEMANVGNKEILQLHLELKNEEVALPGTSESTERLTKLQNLLSPVSQSDTFIVAANTHDTNISLGSLSSDAGDTVVKEEEVLLIPELPRGRVLKIWIETTWGDRHYVGLSGIDVFDQRGDPLQLDVGSSISADPPDINILPGYGSDPRTVDKLVDGVNATCDDLHCWMAPFTFGCDHVVTLEFGETITISMLRIWNYNKSRIHAARGARLVRVTLDDKTVFRGELRKAPGNLADAEGCAEIILFTKDENLIQSIGESMDDLQFDNGVPSPEDEGSSLNPKRMPKRPSTPGDDIILEKHGSASCNWTGTTGRSVDHPPASGQIRLLATKESTGNGRVGKVIQINLYDTWGDANYIGLTGLLLLGVDGQPISITNDIITTSPRDLNDIPGNSGDQRTKDKMIDGVNITTEDVHMWLAPFTAGNSHFIRIDLKEECLVTGIRFWNYNKAPEDAFRGARLVHISIDGAAATPSSGVVIRKAPGDTAFDYGHTIPLSCPPLQGWGMTPRVEPAITARQMLRVFQDSDPPALPRGLVLCISLVGTHGDPYYIGLNGFELYDEHGIIIPLAPRHITARPSSLNELPDVAAQGGGDVRTSDKLVNGINNTFDPFNMWLAPYTPGLENNIYIVFDWPVTVSMVKFWNYSRTPERGAAEIRMTFDSCTAYQGYLRRAPGGCDEQLAEDFSQTVLFTGAAQAVEAEKSHVYSAREEQHVLLVDERKVMGGQRVAGAGGQVAGHSGSTAAHEWQGGGAVGSGSRPMTSVSGRA